jgi:hypothetical protein
MSQRFVNATMLAALILSASDAWAQQRSGFIGGISFGGGALRLNGNGDGDPLVALVRQDDDGVPAVGFDAHLGGMLDERTAVMFVLTGDYDPGRDSDVDVDVRVGDRQLTFSSSTTSLGSGIIGGAIQRWLTSRVWVRGGAGFGFLTRDVTIGSDASYLTMTLDRGYGAAFLAGAGVDVWRKANFAVDVEFHLTIVSLSDLRIYAPTVQVGFNWY